MKIIKQIYIYMVYNLGEVCWWAFWIRAFQPHSLRTCLSRCGKLLQTLHHGEVYVTGCACFISLYAEMRTSEEKLVLQCMQWMHTENIHNMSCYISQRGQAERHRVYSIHHLPLVTSIEFSIDNTLQGQLYCWCGPWCERLIIK